MGAEMTVPEFRRVEHGPAFKVPVRNRAYLAGSHHDNFPEYVPDAGAMIPAYEARQPDRPLSAMTTEIRCLINGILPEHGGVLLRGLPLADKVDFERIVTELGYDRLGYQGGIAIRKGDTGVALNASEEDPRIILSPHNEMAYLPDYPRKVFFFCAAAAREGGEVPVNDVRDTARILPEHIRQEFRSRGIRYHRSLARESSAGAMGWTETFGTDDKEKVEHHLAESGYAYEWDEDDLLRYHYERDAFVTHPDTGQELWFNQVTELHCSYWKSHPDFPSDLPERVYPATTTYGDGATIDEERISYLRGALWRTTRAVRMRRGDILILDNQVLQHGRFSFTGPRRHYVILTR
ncbi:TauD/TfdA family dioxygenase [Streptomyces sp. NPDC002845]